VVDSEFWSGKRVFLTGHTGFKGSWLSLWLQSMGARVHGLALDPPTIPSLFEQARVAEGMTSVMGDIRDLETVREAIGTADPEILIHMAAQPLVGYSYTHPVETYATNVLGTVNVLEAARSAESLRAIVNVTTDKSYENREWDWGYREDEPMGGLDPYSSSKGCAELVTSAYRRSFLAAQGIALASARAGNVIGGGDWAEDRLVPDILRAFEKGSPVVIRNPRATRPWQHVLEPLSGYLVLAEHLWRDGQGVAEAWNFGPHDTDVRPVEWIVEHLRSVWGGTAEWEQDAGDNPHEAQYLKLDISKARRRLAWTPRWDLVTALDAVVEWHRSWVDEQDVQAVTLDQIARFVATEAAA
jgi:CDP-glucose 4,6-dehydratase